MHKEDAVKAVDRAFDAAVARLFDVFVTGLVSGDSADVLAPRATKGFGHAVETHGRMLGIVHDHFPE